MRASDLTVEVRDKDLSRVGLILPQDLDFTLNDQHNNVGTWMLRLSVEHPLTSVLRQPGNGIIVTGASDVLCSGPTVRPEFASSAADPDGMVTFSGVTDTVVLADALAWPQPTNPNPETQTLAHDVRTGPAETVMHAYVNANIGPAATTPRRKDRLVLGPNLGRGPNVKKSARFPTLGGLLTELAVLANLGFRVVQRDNMLVFETFEVEDLTDEIRLDVYNNTLAGQKVATSAPGATRAIVAGQGDLVERQFVAVDSPESIAAEQEWGRRIERFVDQRQTDDLSELRQAGEKLMATEGFTAVSVQVIPMEDSSMRYGIDWSMGDKVTVVVEGQELVSTVTGYALRANKDGFRIGALLGDPDGFNAEAALNSRVQNTESRVSALERNTGTGASEHVHDFPVTSVNNRTGAVTGLAEASHSHTFPVTSVNGRTGAVTSLAEASHGHSDLIGNDADFNTSATFADPPSSFPRKVSVRYVSTAAGSPEGAGTWTLMTVNRSNTVAFQVTHRRGTAAGALYARGYSGTDGWGDWFRLDRPAYADRAADADLLGGMQATDVDYTGPSIPMRSGNGYITARLFRQSYNSTNSTVNFIMTQVGNGTNNNDFIRPSTPAQVAAALAVPQSNSVSLPGTSGTVWTGSVPWSSAFPSTPRAVISGNHAGDAASHATSISTTAVAYRIYGASQTLTGTVHAMGQV